jgi:hypothetical protein
MVRSEKFGTLIGRLVHKNKKSIISFMRSQGISISFNATANQVIEALFVAFKSKKFREAFMSWTRGLSKGMSKGGSSNIEGSQSYASGNFDPMATQSGGFTPMDTQNGANLKGDRFSNTSGNFSTMDTQSGGFTPIDTQSGADLKGGFSRVSGTFTPMSAQGMGKEFDAMSSQQGADLKSGGFSNADGNFSTMDTQSGGFTPMDTQNGSDLKSGGFSNTDGDGGFGGYTGDEFNDVTTSPSTGGDGGGGFFDGFDIGAALGILNTGLGVYSQSDTNKTNRQIEASKLENTRLLIEAQRQKGEIDAAEYKRQMALLNAQASGGGGSKTTLYVVGGVVLVGALGTAIYFATRKK